MLVKDEEAIIEFDGDELLNLNKFGLESVRFRSNEDGGIEENDQQSLMDNLNDEKYNESLNVATKAGRPKKEPDYREEYFLTNFGISMHDFMCQVKECKERGEAIQVKGFGFNGTNLG